MGLEGLMSEDSGVLAPQAPTERLQTMAGATLVETMESNPIASINRIAELGSAYREPDVVPADQARAKIKHEGFEGALVVPDRGISSHALEILMQRKRDARLREEIYAGAPNGMAAGSLKLAMGLAGSLTDPANVVSAFVPVVGEARYAKLLGTAPGILRTTVVRAGVGAAEGVVGAAIVEPFTYAAHNQEQADYDMGNSLLNIGFGGVFGGGLHVGGGIIADGYRSVRERYSRGSAGEIAEQIVPETRAQVLKSAIAQSVSGERVDVEAIVNMDRASEPVKQREPYVDSEGREKPGEAYAVAEQEMTDEQLAAFQGLRSHLPADENLGATGAGIPAEPRNPNDGGPGGEPLRVYRGAARDLGPADFDEASLGHATGNPSSGLGVYFTNTEEEAARYGAVSEHHLDIRNPKVVPAEDLPGFDNLAEAIAYRKQLQAEGYDGMVIDASHLGGQVNYVAFDHEQVRGAAAGGDSYTVHESFDHEPVDLSPVKEAAAAPKLSAVADEAAASQVDASLKDTDNARLLSRGENPTEQDVAFVNEETADILAQLKAADVDTTSLEAFDEAIADAETYGRAAQAAVACGMNHA